MEVTARPASPADILEIVRLYRLLQTEMAALEPVWPEADGIPVPEDAWLAERIADADATVLVGEIDRVPFGFLVGVREELAPQAAGARIGSIRYVFTEPAAREVGIGAAMIEAYLDGERRAGLTLFDAHVTPGHRLTKNFFESHGFTARRIVMHRDTEAPDDV